MIINHIHTMREAEYTRRAIQDLAKMQPKRRKRIMDKIEQYTRAPDELANNVTPLKGQPGKRLTVGGDRVLFEETGDKVTVMRVRPRGKAYKA